METWKQGTSKLLEFGAKRCVGVFDVPEELYFKKWKRGNILEKRADDLEHGPVVFCLVALQERENLRGLHALRVAEAFHIENQLNAVQRAEFAALNRRFEAFLHGFGVLDQAERVLVHFHPAFGSDSLLQHRVKLGCVLVCVQNLLGPGGRYNR